MAPTIFGHTNYPKEHLGLTTKLRKPVVEKLRRDRINSSIEQLKSLLGPDFLRQQPDSKQEKADILEMAVYFLMHQRQQRAESSSTKAAGYSHCIQEVVSFLSQREATQSNRALLSHIQNLQSSSPSSHGQSSLCPPGSPIYHANTKGVSPTYSALWRPW